MSILTRKTMVYAALEGTYGTAPSFSDATDPMLVEDADYKLDVQNIQRNLYRNDLSPVADIITRKMGKMTFKHEIRGGGAVGTECRLGRLLRGCTMLATTRSTAWWGAFIAAAAPSTPAVSWAGGGSISAIVEPKTILIRITTSGVSGVARCSITYDDGTAQQTNVTMTSGSAITLTGGLASGTIAPTWSGTLATSQAWVVTAWPPGIQYLPSSDEQAYGSIAIRMYKDGMLHVLTGAYGTFKINAQAGQRAMAEFEFTGFYNAPTDAALPASPVFETTLPQQCELGRLHIDDFGVAGPSNNICAVDSFSYDIGNKIDPRMSINAADGFTGLRVTERTSTGGIDPEATLVAQQDFWAKLAGGRQMPFGMRVGTTAGNMVAFHAPAVQYTGFTYKDRSGLVALDAALQFNRVNGDDEILIYAC
ncbi:MAG: hypothetical protein U1E21_01045 [Reyranellaceae bacterium]